MSELAHPLPIHCPNCEADVHGPFCAQCGQETVIEAPTLHEFAHEYLHHYVALEGRLWRSLWLLLCKPGELTREFLSGRRRRYVRPLPLYVTLSFLFFLGFSLFPGKNDAEALPQKIVDARVKPDAPKETGDVQVKSAGPSSATDPKKALADLPSNITSEVMAGLAKEKHNVKDVETAVAQDNSPGTEKLNRMVIDIAKHYEADPEGAKERLIHAFTARLPYAIFLLMPLFALMSKLIYWRRKRYYGEHLLFALHAHAFLFLCLLLTYWARLPATVLWLGMVWGVYLARLPGRWVYAALSAVSAYYLPSSAIFVWLGFVWWAYLARGFQQVFGGRLFPQLLRASVVLSIHGLAVIVGMTLVLLTATTAI